MLMIMVIVVRFLHMVIVVCMTVIIVVCMTVVIVVRMAVLILIHWLWWLRLVFRLRKLVVSKRVGEDKGVRCVWSMIM